MMVIKMIRKTTRMLFTMVFQGIYSHTGQMQMKPESFHVKWDETMDKNMIEFLENFASP